MAVTAPTPPTPPTAPTVPQVTLQDGGSVTTSTSPANGQTTPESLARQAVAQGSGALSKTEQEAPQGAANGQGGTNVQSGQANPDAAPGAKQTQISIDPQTAAALGLNADGQNGQSGQNAQTQQGQAVQAIPDGSGGHGALFWGVTIALLFLFGFLLLRTVLRRKAGADAFGARDIRDFVRSLSGGHVNMGEEAPARDAYAGMTADAALRAIEREETVQAALPQPRAPREKKPARNEASPNIAPPIRLEKKETSHFDVQI